MRCFLDCEFIDTGREIILVSIGIEREDGARYYAEVREADLTKASDWVREHVLEYLDRRPNESTWSASLDALVQNTKPRKIIARQIVQFVGPNPVFYAYVDHYDWVCLSQLYGSLVDRPEGWPIGCKDLHLLAELAGIDADDWLPVETELPGFEHLPEGAHRADAGAAWDHRLYDLIQIRAGDEMDYTALIDC